MEENPRMTAWSFLNINFDSDETQVNYTFEAGMSVALSFVSQTHTHLL